MHFDEARISQFGVNVHIFTKSQCEGILVDGITPSYRFESSHHSTSYMFFSYNFSPFGMGILVRENRYTILIDY